MSQSDNGNRKRHPSEGRNSRRRGPRPEGDASTRRENWRDLLPDDAEASASGGGRGGRGRRPQQGQRPQRGGGREGQRRREEPSLEYVLVQPDLSLSAEISAHPGPMRWRPIPDISLLSPGLYLRYKGSLQLVARELLFQDAVLYTVWDDTYLQYRFTEGWASPGLRAAFLVPTPFADNEGPPWIPIDAAIPDSIEEWDRGLLSSQLDPVHCTLFRAKLIADHSGLHVSADSIREDGRERADAALQETMAWLARNPESDHPAAVTARVMLVEQGHGLQRAGISAMSKSDESTTELLQNVLSVLAPEVAPALQAVQALWLASDEEQVEYFVALARALQPHLDAERSPLQQPRNLAVLTTWLTGIFGSRPDRERRRPARSLFAALRLIRRLRGELDALDHPDVDLPTFPTSRELSDEITRELSYFPPNESDLERLVRAMAVGESSRDFHRVTLDHLRPFALSYQRVRGYPVATRTLLGRYDGIVTMWSFRGRELENRDVPARALAANLVFDTTTWASTRAYARVLGYRGAVSDAFAEALTMRPERGRPNHPDLERLAELHGTDPAEIVERLGRASRARRPNSSRVSDAIAAHEYLVALCSRNAEALPEWTPIEPEWEGGDDTAVRRHFMYWRAYCRSFLPSAANAYAAFLARAIPSLESLPWKLENEALALLRIWSRHATSEEIQGYLPALEARLEAILAEEENAARDERVLNILSALAGISAEAWEDGVRQLLEHPQWAEAEWHRILEATRHGLTGESLVESELFKEIGQKLAAETTVGAASGRVEWARQLLGRGRGATAVRWLLHREAWPEVVFSADFEQWFQEHALSALEDPQEATRSLLRLAATLMSPETVDIAMHHLDERSEDDTAALAALLLDANRGLSAAAWLPTREDFGVDHANRALSLGLEEARSALELRTLAMLAHVAKARGLALDDDVLSALKARVQRHVLPDADRVVLGQFLDAWRLLDIELDSEEAANAYRQAALCFSETNDYNARRFLTWGVDRALVAELGEDILAALHEPASLELMLSALDDLPWPEAVQRGLTTLVRIPRRSPEHRALWNALRNGQESHQLEALLDAEVLRRAAQDAQDAHQAVVALEARLEEVLGEGAEEESSNQDASNDTRSDAQADAQADRDEEAAAAEPAADGGASDEESARVTAADRFSGYLRGHVREGAIKRLRSALSYWKNTLTDVTTEQAQALPPALTAAVAHGQTVTLNLREDVYPRVVRAAALNSVKLQDPRNVVANSAMRLHADVAPVALDALLSLAFSLLVEDEESVKASITRDMLTLEQRVASEAAEPAKEDVVAEDTSPDTTEEDEAGAVEESTEESKTEQSVLAQLWAGRPVQDASENAPSRVLIAVMQRLAKRNDVLALRVQSVDAGDTLTLRWSRPRRPGGRRS